MAIDRTSKFAFAELHREAGKATAAQFLRNLIAAVPYALHTVLTDNPVLSFAEGGIQFTNTAHHKYAVHHIFDRVCDEHDIEHRLTKIKHSSTNGKVERMNRTIKEATVKQYHYDSHAQLTAPLHDFLDAYNYARRLKTVKGLTPFEYICKTWPIESDRFTPDPANQTPGPNT